MNFVKILEQRILVLTTILKQVINPTEDKKCEYPMDKDI